VRAPIGDGVILIGDAAGFLNPFTGQGVFLALTSAENAARAIVASAAGRSRERDAFAAYAADRAADFAARKRLSAAVGWLIDVPPLARRAAAKLARRPGLATTMVDALAGTRPPRDALAPAVLGKLVL
jgi:menaquinone-9 beta-reductase